jgi:hypothetical protein
MAVNVIPRSLILQLPFFVWVMMINSSYQLISLLFFRAFFSRNISSKMESTASKGDPGKLQVSKRLPISRPDKCGTKGRKIRLLANHFKVSVNTADVIFHRYNVCTL